MSAKLIYRTTREVTETFGWQSALTGESVGAPTKFVRTPARYVFRGGKRAFAAMLARLNAEHGDGYAVAETA